MNEPHQDVAKDAPAPPRKRSWARRIGTVLLVAFIAMQLIPVEKTNPAVGGDIVAPDEVKDILRRACYDCHSNETRWPWYTYVAPVSWLASKDVIEGRGSLNFSEWEDNHADEDPGEAFRDYYWESIENGSMPLWFYIPLHPEAKLTEQDLAILKKWAKIDTDEEMEEETEAAESEEVVPAAAP